MSARGHRIELETIDLDDLRNNRSLYNEVYYQENADDIKRVCREYYAKNRERVIKRNAEYAKKRAEKTKEYQRKYFQKNKKSILKQRDLTKRSIAWREKVNARQNQLEKLLRSLTAEERAALPFELAEEKFGTKSEDSKKET